MKNLISNTSFGEYLNTKNILDYEYRYLRFRYDQFLIQPLELWMFVSCDEDGNVLEEPPKNVDINNVDWQIEYQQAKERCLFDGFDVEMITPKYSVQIINKFSNSRIVFWNGKINYSDTEISFYCKTIEDLVKYNLQLTPTAQKQIAL